MTVRVEPSPHAHGQTGALRTDLRAYLAELETKGKLHRVKQEVDKDWELACIARWMYQAVPEQDRYALLFERVKGFSIPVVCAAVGPSRQVYAMAMGVPLEQLYDRWAWAIAHPVQPLVWQDEWGTPPVKETILKGDQVDLYSLPIPIWTPGKDAGPYITAGSFITKDPEIDFTNAGVYRQQVRSRNSVGVQIIANQHVGMHLQMYRKLGKPMPAAVLIGIDPGLTLSSTAKVPYGVSEYSVAGAFRGAPLELTKAETVDLMVPARTEIVLEGLVYPDEEEMEGPFGEYVGYMGLPSPKAVLHVNCITHRSQPIYQAYVSQIPPSESCTIQRIAMSAVIYRQLVHDLKIQGIRDVNVTEQGARLHAVVKMKPIYPGHSKKVMLITANLLDAATPKWVTVVDEDVDIHDATMVEWAIASRVDPAKDVMVLDDVEAAHLDPATTLDLESDLQGQHLGHRILGSKLLIDATIKKRFPALSMPPRDAMLQTLERWDSYGLPPISAPSKTLNLLDKHPETNLYIEPFK